MINGAVIVHGDCPASGERSAGNEVTQQLRAFGQYRHERIAAAECDEDISSSDAALVADIENDGSGFARIEHLVVIVIHQIAVQP